MKITPISLTFCSFRVIRTISILWKCVVLTININFDFIWAAQKITGDTKLKVLNLMYANRRLSVFLRCLRVIEEYLLSKRLSQNTGNWLHCDAQSIYATKVVTNVDAALTEIVMDDRKLVSNCKFKLKICLTPNPKIRQNTLLLFLLGFITQLFGISYKTNWIFFNHLTPGELPSETDKQNRFAFAQLYKNMFQRSPIFSGPIIFSIRIVFSLKTVVAKNWSVFWFKSEWLSVKVCKTIRTVKQSFNVFVGILIRVKRHWKCLKNTLEKTFSFLEESDWKWVRLFADICKVPGSYVYFYLKIVIQFYVGGSKKKKEILELYQLRWSLPH